ncbi:MAG: hypothetical protein EZS28_035325 [Streblomastix strix]|uniref:Uncharacterized protein n=1 Tax=Streblomastix strix TaxID=222440 RepID=A0A5J4UET8_9EUKA|nr:MAG: hypothetical protein EZS28_035325 [Streblomastix strix]
MTEETVDQSNTQDKDTQKFLDTININSAEIPSKYKRIRQRYKVQKVIDYAPRPKLTRAGTNPQYVPRLPSYPKYVTKEEVIVEEEPISEDTQEEPEPVEGEEKKEGEEQKDEKKDEKKEGEKKEEKKDEKKQEENEKQEQEQEIKPEQTASCALALAKCASTALALQSEGRAPLPATTPASLSNFILRSRSTSCAP